MTFTYQILYDAWKKVVTMNSEEPNRVRFRYFLESNLYSLLERLNTGTFKPMPMRNKTILHPKKRVAQVPTLEDKIIQTAICENYLNDAITKPLIKETSACLIGRGDLYASKITKQHLSHYYKRFGKDFYVLKCDIHHYFASIPHERLFELIDRYVDDSDIKAIMKQFIDMMPVGIALGLRQSQLLANLYLSELDHIIKEKYKARYYMRHMDDFYIISNDHKYLEDMYDFIKSYVESIGLTLNPKTAIMRNRIDFLGFTYTVNDTGHIVKRLEKKKRNAKRRHLKFMLKQLEDREITIERFAESYNGWRSHAMNGDCYSLVRAWDSWLRGEVNKLGYELIFDKRRVIAHVKNDSRT